MSDLITKDYQVLNIETNKWVRITPEERKYANYIYQQFQISSVFTAIALKKIFDKKLYIALGYESKEDFILNGTNYSRAQAYRLAKVADKLSGYLPQLDQNIPISGQIPEEAASTIQNNNISPQKDLSGLGITKLIELSKLEEDELEQFINKGSIGEDDDQLTFDEFKDITVRKAAKELEVRTKSYKRKIKDLEDKNSALKEDKKKLESEIDGMQRMVNDAKDLELKYGAPASLSEAKKDLLSEVDNLINEIAVRLKKADVTIRDAEKVQDRFRLILKSLDEVRATFKIHYEDSNFKDSQVA